MIKSEAGMELDQKSTCSLREPTLNKQESEDFSKSKTSLGWLIWSSWRNEIGAVVSPVSFRSTSEAGSSPELRSGQKCGLSKLKGLQSKGLDSVVSAEAWIRSMRKRSMIRFVISRTRFNPRFLSFRVKGLVCRIFSFRKTTFVLGSILQVVSNVIGNRGPTTLGSIGQLNQFLTFWQKLLTLFQLFFCLIQLLFLSGEDGWIRSGFHRMVKPELLSFSTFFHLMDWTSLTFFTADLMQSSWSSESTRSKMRLEISLKARQVPPCS